MASPYVRQMRSTPPHLEEKFRLAAVSPLGQRNLHQLVLSPRLASVEIQIQIYFV